MGFEPVGSREVAREPASAANLATGVSLLRLAIACVGVVVLGLVALFLDKPDEVRRVVFLTGLVLLPLALDSIWVYRGLARNRRAGFSMVLSQAVYVSALLVVVRSPTDVFWVPLALVLGEMVAVSYLALPLLRNWAGEIHWQRAWDVLRSSGFLVSSGLLGALIRTTDIVLIALLLGEAHAGVYSAAYRVCFLVMALANSLHWTYVPRLAQISLDNLAAMSRMIGRAAEASASLAIPVVVGGWILAAPLLNSLFGADYTAGQRAFQILLLAMGMFFLHGILFQVLVVYDRTRPELLIRATASTLNLGLNFALIPRYGIAGAATATLMAESVILACRWVVCRRLGLRISVQPLLKPVVAAAGMAALMFWAVPRWPWPVVFVSGGATYLILLVALRGYPKDFLPQSWQS